MRQIKIFVAQGISRFANFFLLLNEFRSVADVPEKEAQTVLKVKSDPLTRFIHVMKSLAYVYDLGLANLHIFYDTKGGLIAFNRNRSIFLNLRYYEAWRK